MQKRKGRKLLWFLLFLITVGVLFSLGKNENKFGEIPYLYGINAGIMPGMLHVSQGSYQKGVSKERVGRESGFVVNPKTFQSWRAEKRLIQELVSQEALRKMWADTEIQAAGCPYFVKIILFSARFMWRFFSTYAELLLTYDGLAAGLQFLGSRA